VTLFADPPLQAEIMMRSSIKASLIFELPDWTTKTSFSLTLVMMRTLVSPCDNRLVLMRIQGEWEGSGPREDSGRNGGEGCEVGQRTGCRAEERAYIGELGELGVCRSHAQVLTDLACEDWA
jgi:hypothetical protein